MSCCRPLLYGLYVLTAIFAAPLALYIFVIPAPAQAVLYWIGFTFVAVTNAIIVASSLLAIICCLWRYLHKRRYYVWNVDAGRYQMVYSNDLRHLLEHSPETIATDLPIKDEHKSILEPITIKISHDLPRIAIIIPANLPRDRHIIEDTLARMGELTYPNEVDVILVYHASDFPGKVELMDRLAALQVAYPSRYLHKQLHLVELNPKGTQSASKADHLNYIRDRIAQKGLPEPAYVAIFDADHRPEKFALMKGIYLLRKSGAAILQGRCVTLNNQKCLTRLVGTEFDMIYILHHKGGELLRGMGFFGGSNGIWSWPAFQDIGMDPTMLTEDIDASLRAIIRGYRIVYSTDVISYEFAPTTLISLAKQRIRWSQGWFQVALKHTGAILRCPYISCWTRFMFFMMLCYREIAYYAASQVGIVFLVSLFKGTFAYDPYLILSTALSWAILPVTLLMVYTYIHLDIDRNSPPEYQPLTIVDYVLFCLMSPFYNYFMFIITVLAHLSEFMGPMGN